MTCGARAPVVHDSSAGSTDMRSPETPHLFQVEEELATLAEVADHVELVACVKGVAQGHDVRVAAHAGDVSLVESVANLLPLLNVLFLQHLYC